MPNQKKISGQGGEDLTLLPVQAFPAISVFRKPIEKELTRRKESFGKNNLPSTVWCRLLSNSRPKNTNIRRPQRNEREDVHILMGAGTLENGRIRGGFESIYGYKRSGANANEQLLRPTPGIENIAITMEGELGSLRRAKITWNAPSIFDLEELSPYFLTPGATAILEWGWGIFQNGQVTAIGFGNNNKNLAGLMLNFFKNPQQLYQRAIDAQGLYDAMLGYITNFEWSANQDGSFTCTTEITTMGELMASVHLREQRNSTNPKKVNVAKTMKEFVSDEIDKVISDFKVTEDKFKKGIDVIKFGKDDDSTYISWGFLEDKIINPTMKWSNEGKPSGSGFFPAEINSTNSFISNDPNLISVDSNILIAKGKKDILNFNVPNDKFTGILRHIYLKLEFVKTVFEKAETFQDLFMKFYNIANNASSNIWRLSLYVNPLSEKLSTIDRRYVNDLADKIEPRRIFSLGGFGKETVLKNLNLVSKITSQLAMTYIFAKNKDSDEEKDIILNDKDDMGIKTLYGGFDDLVAFKLRTRNKKKVGSQAQSTEEAAAETEKRNIQKRDAALANIKDAIEKGNTTFVPRKNLEFVVLDPNAKTYLKRILHRKTKENRRRKQQVFAPLELNVTIDGIGGIIPGNIFRVENIPEVYEKNGVFQVIRVEHDISPNTWDTKISAYFKIIKFDDTVGDDLPNDKTEESLKEASGDDKTGAGAGGSGGGAG